MTTASREGRSRR